MSTSRRVAGGAMEQGSTEIVAYEMDFVAWVEEVGSLPVSWNSCQVYDKTEGKFVNEKLSGVGGVNGTWGISQLFSQPELGHQYQLVTALNFPGGVVLSCYVQIVGRV